VSDRYVLDEKGQPVQEQDLIRWATWFGRSMEPDPERGARRVAVSALGDWRISTVFLGIDHRFGSPGPPVLWETLVFGPEPWGGWTNRYTSRSDAEAGHKRLLNALIAGDAPAVIEGDS